MNLPESGRVNYPCIGLDEWGPDVLAAFDTSMIEAEYTVERWKGGESNGNG